MSWRRQWAGPWRSSKDWLPDYIQQETARKDRSTLDVLPHALEILNLPPCPNNEGFPEDWEALRKWSQKASDAEINALLAALELPVKK